VSNLRSVYSSKPEKGGLNHRPSRPFYFVIRYLSLLLLISSLSVSASLPSSVLFLPGAINGLLIKPDILVYGDAASRIGNVKYVLFTHARRDVVWAGVPFVARGAKAIVPERERELFVQPAAFWHAYETARFHDYSQVNTKVLTEPLAVSQTVHGGETLTLSNLRVDVVDTPGYTRGAVSYLFNLAGTRIACTGDLIYGDGQILDLSSLQDAIPETKTRGYHGYAARAGLLIASLRRIAALKPDVIVPARGPVIDHPQAAIAKLIVRIQSLMASHFATDALLWYWGQDSLRIRSSQVLDGRSVDSMPMAEQRPLPDWALAIGNSRLILSRDGAGFIVDAGYRGLQSKLNELTTAGRLKSVDGIWITHYHDDHTDYAQETSNRYHCPIYFTHPLQDVLQNPGAYRLPCLTTNPITSGKPQANGAHMRWHEFNLTFFDFPGQTLYHDGLLVERDDGAALFFLGDSFTPSGIDDYCLQNRDFAAEGEGYLYCLRVLGRLPKQAWLINQHVDPTFRFSPAQMDRMRNELLKRIAILRELSPWPDLNFAIDESWAAIHPYSAETTIGRRVTIELHILNHAPQSETFTVHWNTPPGLRLVESDTTVTSASHREAIARAAFIAASPGLHIPTADISMPRHALRQWTESLILVR
jgi:glyoxylase-like metal-dependent hydrolase (beta-lactamase superfamily II)